MASQNIINVRRKASQPDAATADANLRAEILAGLSAPPGQRSLPTLLLYDESGLRLYDDITTQAPEYYLFAAEEEILKHHGDEIVQAMRGGISSLDVTDEQDTIVLELGAGALRKTAHILSALAKSAPASSANPRITYYALDLEERELHRTLNELAASDIGPALKGKIDAQGMLGTYDEGIQFVEEGGLRGRPPALDAADGRARGRDASIGRDASPGSDASAKTSRTGTTPPSTPGAEHGPLHILFLGSSIGNFPRGADAAFLRSLPLRAGAGDTLLLGLDRDNEARKIEVAYNDPQGHTREFIMNGLRAAGRVMGDEKIFDEGKWEYVNRYNVEHRRHEAYYKSMTDQTFRDPASGTEISFFADEMVKVEESNKYSDTDAYALFSEANLRPIQSWTDSSSQYSLWLLERPPFLLPLLKSPSAAEPSAPFGVPTVADWDNVWAVWNYVTLRMIPPALLYKKPIDLRHICLFYIGHIPTFLDIHLSRLLDEPHTEPIQFKDIFERGIDPNVDDPTQCHDHSLVPERDEDWPTLESILNFRDRVRARLMKIYEDIASGKRALTRKVGRVLFMTLEHQIYHTETLLFMLLQTGGAGTVPPPEYIPPPWGSLAQSWEAAPQPASPTVTLGPETVTLGHDDIEEEDALPERQATAASHEYGWDNESPARAVHVDQFRIEWRPVSNGQFLEFYRGAGKGKVLLPKSWVEVNGEIQVRTLYGPVPIQTARHWPVLTDHDGLSTYATVKGGRLPTEAELRLFHDKFDCGYEGGANVGFRNWHPVPATTGVGKEGRGHNGGVWEWTSTVFDKYEGFVPSKLYPGFSADFFDDCHNVVLGGSYALFPRLSERRTLRNYFQRNYGYAWTGGRVVYDSVQ